jgi:hypothetical protein
LDESCISNPKLEILNWTCVPAATGPIYDFGFRI